MSKQQRHKETSAHHFMTFNGHFRAQLNQELSSVSGTSKTGVQHKMLKMLFFYSGWRWIPTNGSIAAFSPETSEQFSAFSLSSRPITSCTLRALRCPSRSCGFQKPKSFLNKWQGLMFSTAKTARKNASGPVQCVFLMS